MIKEKLFWERFRPKKIESIILLPRIKDHIKDGIQTNLFFYGPPGTGKSSLAGILTKDTNCLKINCSLQNGIDIVREMIEEHCTTYSLLGKKGIKTVWLDEFDGSTRQFQEGLRGFIEEHHNVVRFIATANNIAKIHEPILSRFRGGVINFEPINQEEIAFLKKNQLKYLKSVCKSIDYVVNDVILNKLIDKNFPDFRASVQDLQEIYITKDPDSIINNVSSFDAEIFEFILNGNINLKDSYFYVMDNFQNKTQDLLKILSRPLIKYLIDNNPQFILSEESQQIVKLSKEYNAEYSTTMDPEVHLFSYVVELKKLLKNYKK